jgi:hypothetical protein
MPASHSLMVSEHVVAVSVLVTACLTFNVCAPGNRDTGVTKTFGGTGWGYDNLVELSSLNAAGGWLVNDTLVLTADVTVEREDRFQVDTGAPFAAFIG